MIRILTYIITAFAIILPTTLLSQTNMDMKIKTIVIDAGHGGRDPGTISRNKKIYEKHITLSVALRLGELIKEKHKDVKVIFTRSTDKYLTLNQRADIANKNKADLFISIHVNGAGATSARGIETYVMGAEKTENNWEACLKENSVINLEEDYSSKYSGFDPNNPESYIIFSLLQNSHLEQSLALAANVQNNLILGPIKASRGVKQGPFLLLWKCTMPSILVELGFISNSTDLKYLSHKTYQNQMAYSIFKAISTYKSEYEKNNQIEIVKVEKKEAKEPRFTIQIMATSKHLPAGSKEFKGLKGCKAKKVGKIYKYSHGEFSTYTEAKNSLHAVQKKFPQAYIINIDK